MSLEEIKNAKNPFTKDGQTEFVKMMLTAMTDAAVDEAIEEAGDWEQVDSIELIAAIVSGYTDVLNNFIGRKKE